MDWMFRKTTHRRIRALFAPKAQAASFGGLAAWIALKIQRWLFVGDCDYSSLSRACQPFRPKIIIFFFCRSPGTIRSGNSAESPPLASPVATPNLST